jgi:hypothetical protein
MRKKNEIKIFKIYNFFTIKGFIANHRENAEKCAFVFVQEFRTI